MSVYAAVRENATLTVNGATIQVMATRSRANQKFITSATLDANIKTLTYESHFTSKPMPFVRSTRLEKAHPQINGYTMIFTGRANGKGWKLYVIQN